MHGSRSGHPPRPLSRVHSLQQTRMNSEPSQRMLPSGSRVPPQPEALPDVPFDPALQPEDGFPHCGQLEVLPPAPHVAAPGVPQLVAGSTLAAIPQLPHLRFEALDTLRRYSDPLLAVQSKARELAFARPSPFRSWRRSPSIADASQSRPAPQSACVPPPPDCLRRCCSHRHSGKTRALAAAAPLLPVGTPALGYRSCCGA